MQPDQPYRPVGNRADFATCYRPSKWAEDAACEALNLHPNLCSVPYGFSAEKDVDAALYQSTETHGKRPDLLVFTREVYADLVKEYGRDLLHRLDTTPDDQIPTRCIKNAMCAIEIEWSRGEGHLMAEAAQIKKKASLDKYQGLELVKGSELVTYLKAPDVKLLKQWQSFSEVPLFICQFYSDGYTRLFDLKKIDKELRQKDSIIKSERKKYSAKEKMMTRYKVPFTLGIDFASCTQKPQAGAERIVKENGRVDIVETVEGGTFALTGLSYNMLTGKTTSTKGETSSPLRATTELERLIMSKWIKTSGTTGAEIYAKMNKFERDKIQQALSQAVEDGMLTKKQRAGMNYYLRTI